MVSADAVRAEIVQWTSIASEFEGDGTAGDGGVLLLGNGFSVNVWAAFRYDSLLEESGLAGAARTLFGTRTNFEAVLAELSVADQVVRVAAPEAAELPERLSGLASEVREALFAAVDKVHPDAYQLAGSADGVSNGFTANQQHVVDELAAHLPRYAKVFVTNYDLLAYWGAVKGELADLFPGRDPFDERRAERWSASSRTKIFFLHGALHLWRSLRTNAEGKHTVGLNSALLDEIRLNGEHVDRVPLFISEGTSAEKVARISASPYLSFCGRALADATEPVTVLGQGLTEADRHISDAIQEHPERRVAVGVHVDASADETARASELRTKAAEVGGRLSRCREVVFFDSAEHPLTSPRLFRSPS